MDDVPLKDLQFGDYLQKLTLKKVPVRHLELNDRLQELTLDDVPLAELQFNDHLHKLLLNEVPLKHLQLNDNLHTFTLKRGELSYLHVNDQLHTLTLEELPLAHLQLNDNLQELTLAEVPLTQLHLNNLLLKLNLRNVPISELQLNDHLKELNIAYGPVSSRFPTIANGKSSAERGHQLTDLKLNDQLERLILMNVPLSQLQINRDLKWLVMQRVPVSNLQLNKQLVELEIHDVPLTQLQPNGQLQRLELKKVPLSNLQLNDHLKQLTLEGLTLIQLQVNDKLEDLTLERLQLSPHSLLGNLVQILSTKNIPFTHLQPNDNLKTPTMKTRPHSHLQLGDYKTHNRNIRLSWMSLSNSTFNIFLDKVMNCQLDVSLKLSDIILTDMNDTEQQETFRNDITQGQSGESYCKSLELNGLNMNSKVFQETVDTILKSEHSVTLSLSNVTVEDVTSKEQQTVNQYNAPGLALGGHNFPHSKKSFQFRDITLSYGTFKQFVDTVQECRYPITVKLRSMHASVL